MTRHALAAARPERGDVRRQLVRAGGRSTADRRPSWPRWAWRGRWVGSPSSSKRSDRNQLEWLWEIAPNDLTRLARCVAAFEKRYPPLGPLGRLPPPPPRRAPAPGPPGSGPAGGAWGCDCRQPPRGTTPGGSAQPSSSPLIIPRPTSPAAGTNSSATTRPCPTSGPATPGPPAPSRPSGP